MTTTGNVFITSKKLPWVHDAVLAVVNVAPGGSAKKDKETNARRDAINTYVAEVEELWINAFGKEHVCERKTIARKLRTALQVYFNKVSCAKESHSKRELLNEWKTSENVHCLFDLLKSTSDLASFEEAEFLFYTAQLSGREGYVTDEVDQSYETSEPMNIENVEHVIDAPGDVTDEEVSNDTEFLCPEEEDFTAIQEVQVRTTRSGTKIFSPAQDPALSHPIPSLPKPQIRKVRNCTDSVKAAISKISYECGISVEKSRRALQIISKEMYGHQYYLTLQEKKSSTDPNLKRKITDINYEEYDDILPSAKSIRNYKSLQATQEEIDAAIALYNKKEETDNVTFHFDTTSRNCIDGEWPALILNFREGLRFNLRPVYVAYEDRENIARVLAETYERLAVAAEVKMSTPVSAKELWEKTDNLMTDSVTKNLNIGPLIASKLGSSHIPKALLCNAHVVEKFDDTNLNVLADVERKLKLRERLEKINPSLRPFFRGKKAIVVAGIQALLKLITHDKSGNTVSLAEEFDELLESEGLVKHMVLYHERRFTNLGYCAASILSALPQLHRLLDETHKANLLVQACKLYIDCELFLAELHVLAVFTQNVTLPFLNCLEKSTQKDLLVSFPKLYHDLTEHRMDTLKDFFVPYRHVTVEAVTDEREMIMLNRMCEEAAKGFDMQRGAEYGFGVNHPDRPTTRLHELSEKEVNAIVVVHNLACERVLGTFGHRATVAKYRNKFFTAQGIRDDMVLVSSEQSTVQSTTRKINRILKKKESEWTDKQKKLRTLRIQKKMAESQSQLSYTKKLLQACKSWGGPATTPDELEDILNKRTALGEKIVKTELSYYCKTHEAERRNNPEIFKIMIAHDQRLENLIILLGDNNHIATSESSSVLDLPTMKEFDDKFGTKETVPEAGSSATVQVNEMCVVVWLEKTTDKPMWHLGYVTKLDGEQYIVEHLVREKSSGNNYWKNPGGNDQTFPVDEEQFLLVKVNGEWEVDKISGHRISMRYHLMNSMQIDNAFKKMEG